MVSVYNSEDLFKELSNITDTNEDVIKFYKNFSFDNLIKENNYYNNSAQIFKDETAEETNSSKMIQLLNKLHNKNIQKTVFSLREIKFNSVSELTELVNLCIQKIKRENEQIKPLIGMLCYELLSVYCIDENNEKIYFRKILLTNIKNDYFNNIDYNNEQWLRENSVKLMTVIGILFNCAVIDSKILLSIFDDFIKCIEYTEIKNENDFADVEKSIQLLLYLSSTLILNDNINEKCKNMYDFLETQKNIYNNCKKICKKSRLEICSCIDAFSKLFN